MSKLIRLSYNGHYPDKIVSVTNGEWTRIQELTKHKFLFDTNEGRRLIRALEARPQHKDYPMVEVYT